MAQLAIVGGAQLAGYALGGGPIGAAIGGLAGSYIYNEFFAPEPPTQQGPNFGDAQITGSAYGQAIPEIYGTMVVGGNIIDAGPIETEKKTSGGGSSKGGPKEPKTTTFTHYADLDVLIGSGPITALLKIWVNEQLIYDSTAGATIVQPSWLNFRFYDGGTGQAADPTFETIHGANGVPAYQGLAHVVFERFKLDEFGLGERIALQFKFLVSRNGTYAAAETIFDTTTHQSTSTNVLDLLYAEQPDLIIVAVDTSEPSGQGTAIVQAINPYTEELAWKRRYTGTLEEYGDNLSFCSIPIEYSGQQVNIPAAQIVYTIGSTSGLTDSIEVVDAETGKARVHADMPEQETPYWLVAPFANKMTLYRFRQTGAGPSSIYRMEWGGTNQSATITTYPWTDKTITKPTGYQGITGRPPGTNGDGILLMGWDDGAGSIAVLAVDDRDMISDGDLTLENETLTVLSAASDIYSIEWDATQEAFWVLCPRSADSDMQLYKIDTSGAILDNWNLNTDIGISGTVTFGDAGMAIDNFRGRIVFGKGGIYYSINTADPTQLLESYTDVTLTETGGVIHPYTSRFYTGGTGVTGSQLYYVHIVQLNTGAAGSETLKNVLDGISAFGNTHLTASDYDNSAFSGVTVNGFLMARAGMSKAAAIGTLRTAYLFDLVPRDGVITGILRGTQSSAITLTEDTIGAHIQGSGAPQAITITRESPESLPVVTEVDYINPDQNYERGSQQARRLATPSGTGTTVKASLALALTDDEGAQLADTWLHSQHIESERYLVQCMPSTADDVQPGALVTISYDGETYLGRVEKADIVDGMIVDARIMRSDNSIYTTYSVGGTVRNTNATVYAIGTAILIPIDAPAMRTEDFDGGYYVAAYSQTSSWPGAEVFRSTDSQNYSSAAQLPTATTIGVVRSVDAGLRALHYMTQRDITVELFAGATLTSQSLSDLESTNDNAFAIGVDGRWCYGRFLTATQNADDSWTISGLVLGIQGTEQYVDDIAQNDRFVLIDSASMDRVNLAASQVGGVDYLKPVTLGRSIDEAPLVTQVPSGEALRPFAPYDLHASGFGSDITLTWVRRDKLWPRPWWQAAMSESTESYTIDILDSDLASVRTITATSETATYTSAQQTADGNSGITFLYWRVAQVSADVGSGAYAYAASGSKIPFNNAILSYSPAIYLELEETTGTSIADSSGNGNTGTLSGTRNDLNVDGAFGSGWNPNFDGTTAFGGQIDCNNDASLQVNDGDFSAGFWINFNRTPASGNVSNVINHPNNIKLNFSESGGDVKISATVYFDTTNTVTRTTADLDLTQGVWHLFVYTFDSATKTGDWYQDGALVNSGTYDLDQAGSGTASTPSADFDVGGFTQWHILDEVFVVATELSAAQVLDLYNKLTE